MTQTTLAPVRKTITVNAPAERAFQVFTAGMDAWWPRSHHIGKAPLRKVIVQQHAGGRCYNEQTDGTECDWGSVLVWEPPHRVVIAWQITPQWQFEPDLARSSEVEIRFTAEAAGTTRVDLEHRHIERHGDGADAMQTAVDSPGGWTGVLRAFAVEIDAPARGALSGRERTEALRQLETSGRAMAAAVGELTDAEWIFRTEADRWSIAECVEHVAIVEERVLGRLNALAQGPAGSTRAAHTDGEVLARVQSRTPRFVAPEPIRPSLRWIDRPSGLAAFEAARQRTIQFARTTEADLRARTAPHPIFGELDAYQWLLAAAAHSLRHVEQIEEIKIDPRFPSHERE